MDSILEKKWFVYLGDRHEGPFSVEEIQEKIAEGQATEQNFVWKEGMPDWKVMIEIPEFRPIPTETQEKGISEKNLPIITENPIPKEIREEPLISAFQTASEPKPEIASLKNRRLKDPIIHKRPSQSIEMAKGEKEQVPPPQRSWKLIPLLLLFAVAAYAVYPTLIAFIEKTTGFRVGSEASDGLSQPSLMRLVERLPILSEWISPIPSLEGVSPDDLEELKLAAKERLEAGGSRFAIALSRTHPMFPKFYVSSNLPDGAGFELFVIGNSDTLLGQTSFVNQSKFTLQKKLGASVVIQFPDGKPIPRGEYTVYLIAGESQPPLIQSFLNTALVLATKPPHDLPKNSKILGYKTYFLGGERDSTYLSRLKSYHDSLRKKATEELANIKQYVITLEAQFEATRGKFEPLQKGKINKKQRKDWEIFHTNWAKLQKELHQNIQSWTPEMIKNEFFYGSLFVLTQQAEQGIAQLHEFQNTFFEKPSDPNTVQIQIGESTSSVRNALTLLRSKIEETEKTPLSPNGMPRRDEL